MSTSKYQGLGKVICIVYMGLFLSTTPLVAMEEPSDPQEKRTIRHSGQRITPEEYYKKNPELRQKAEKVSTRRFKNENILIKKDENGIPEFVDERGN